ncbi:hypothetical protein [Haloplasma contractile]|uniref:Uncharacterized protein n=1 Tax=Haloplasma contractile SSD-17B TaxID=1033810 RepID=F7Q1V7_9MOLU|nr:hypothetical protein [Haloplasma contractile]ERJ12232.1 hypothetical protein HLPCO_001759 [Haloplasma contractile SSD-17B]
MSDFDKKILDHEADKIMERIYEMKQDQRSRFNVKTILFSTLTFLIISVAIYFIFTSIVSNASKGIRTFETENRYESRISDKTQTSTTKMDWIT